VTAAFEMTLDRIVPPVDDLPGAGTLVGDDVERLARETPRYGRVLARVLAALRERTASAGGFARIAVHEQDAALRAVQALIPDEFAGFLELVYLAYYQHPRVRQRIGWHGRPPQPLGYDLSPFDESILDRVRGRQPFWRKDE
jgi:hypothetical protein